MCTLPSLSSGEPTAINVLVSSAAIAWPKLVFDSVGLIISSSKLYDVDACNTFHLPASSILSTHIFSPVEISSSAYLFASSNLATRFDLRVEISPATPVMSLVTTLSPKATVTLFIELLITLKNPLRSVTFCIPIKSPSTKLLILLSTRTQLSPSGSKEVTVKDVSICLYTFHSWPSNVTQTYWSLSNVLMSNSNMSSLLVTM